MANHGSSPDQQKKLDSTCRTHLISLNHAMIYLRGQSAALTISHSVLEFWGDAKCVWYSWSGATAGFLGSAGQRWQTGAQTRHLLIQRYFIVLGLSDAHAVL